MIFRRKISRYEEKRVLRDKAMRRSLLEILQEATKEHREGRPEYMRDDEDVEEELKRILRA